MIISTKKTIGVGRVVRFYSWLTRLYVFPKGGMLANSSRGKRFCRDLFKVLIINLSDTLTNRFLDYVGRWVCGWAVIPHEIALFMLKTLFSHKLVK